MTIKKVVEIFSTYPNLNALKFKVVKHDKSRSFEWRINDTLSPTALICHSIGGVPLYEDDDLKAFCVEMNLSTQEVERLFLMILDLGSDESYSYIRRDFLGEIFSHKIFREFPAVQSVEFSTENGISFNRQKVPMVFWRIEDYFLRGDLVDLNNDDKAWLVEMGINETEASSLVRRVMAFGNQCSLIGIPVPEFSIQRGEG